MAAVPPWLPLTELGVVAALLGSLLGLRWLDRTRDWAHRRRERLLLGLPWGSLLCVGGVLLVYLVLQGGLAHWYDPLTIPYRAWSYFYPLGMGLAAFAHGGPGHLLGNLAAALVLAPIAEYAWGHYPTGRGERSFGSPTRNPYVRAFLLFPAGVVIIGVVTALFSWGPIIGFSGVVFAFAGFALVRYPLTTVLALVAENLVRLLVDVLRDPVITAEARPQFVTPWWAGVATQGHLLGLFLGVVAGALVLDRSDRPPARRLFLGALLVASSLSLWLVWWYRGGEQYVLYRGLGVILLFLVAALITVGLGQRWADGDLLDVPRRQVAVLLLVFPVLVVGFAAVPLNLVTVADPTPPGSGEAIHVGDYTVSYAEGVPNQMVSVVNLSAFGETTAVRTSGVIVVSEDRQVWTQALSSSRLAFAGQGRVVVGGVGWRENVSALRRGWTATGNGTAYLVWLRPPESDASWRVVYESPPVVAEPVVAGNQVALRPENGSITLELRRNGSTVERTAFLTENESATLGTLQVVRENASIFAVQGDTKVRVASRETYEG